MTTERITSSYWHDDDEKLAMTLWGDPQVTRFICASGVFMEDEIRNCL